MNEREPIGKKLRFEVFKRDSFTCQYCGARAPDVLLHADHIKPVADGGKTDVLNLITACQSCNAGKGARLLSDSQVVDKQTDQLAALEERRQQLEMMMQWRDELQNLGDQAIDMISARIGERAHFAPNESGRADIKRWLKKYTPAELMRAIDESYDTYLVLDKDQHATSESWNKAFSKIPAVAAVLAQEADKPYLRRILFIQAIIRKRSRAYRYDCVDFLEHLVLEGYDIDELERRSKKLRSIEEFEKPLDDWLNSIGRQF
jgi:hypothetical protein